MVFLTLYFSALASINTGLITTIWGVSPVFIGLLDYLIFRVKLKYYHYIGMFSIVACTILLSISGVIIP